MIRVAFDIGGTFTDFVLHDSGSGRTITGKVPTSPDDPSSRGGGPQGNPCLGDIGGGDLAAVLHATTVATNAISSARAARPRS